MDRPKAADQPGERTYAGRTAVDRRAERRDRLMAAGLELFGTAGYPATSIERLCSAAAVSTRNFYEEFPGREALLMAVHDRILDQAVEAVGAALAAVDQRELAARIEAGFRAYVATVADDPRRARVAGVEVIGVSAEVEAHREAWRTRWAEILVGEAERAAARGEAPRRDFTLSAVAIVGAVNELVHHWSARAGALPREELLREIVAFTRAVIVSG